MPEYGNSKAQVHRRIPAVAIIPFVSIQPQEPPSVIARLERSHMISSAKSALEAYSQVGLNAKVAAASPHGLIIMLFDGAIAAITKAKYHMEKSTVDDIAEKGAAISKAIAIIDDGLKASLNMEVGGELAQNLDSLYEYMSFRLVHANLKNDKEILDEISQRLLELREAWDSIGVRQDSPTGVGARSVNSQGIVTYGKV